MNTLELNELNKRLSSKLVGATKVSKIPVSAILGMHTSKGTAVFFTEKSTYILHNNITYKGIRSYETQPNSRQRHAF